MDQSVFCIEGQTEEILSDMLMKYSSLFVYVYYNNSSCILHKSQTCDELLKVIAGFLYIVYTF